MGYAVSRLLLLVAALAALTFPPDATARAGAAGLLLAQAADADDAADGEAPQPDAEAEDAPQPAAGAAAGAYSRVEGQQDQWGDQHAMYRARHPFVHWAKLLGVLLLFFFWVRTCAWVNRSSQLYSLGYARWNSIVVGAGLLGLILAVSLPIYAAAIGLQALLVLGPFIAYTLVHNRSVEQHQRAFTSGWWRYEFAKVANKVGMKVDADIKADYEKGAPVDLIAMGAADATENQANLLTARRSPGYLLVKELIADMVNRRSDRVLLDYTPETVASRHYIDGVWDAGPQRDREGGDVMLAVMKQLANLDVKERAKKQSGKFAARYNGDEFGCKLTSQGVKTGERVMLSLVRPKSKEFKSYHDLGMREKLSEQWAEVLVAPQGLIVVSAMPEAGLTTLVDISLQETDRLMRDVFSIEDKNNPEREIENIAQHFYDPGAGQSPATVLPKLMRLYPDTYICRDLVNTESATALIEQAAGEKLVITTVRAKDAAESLLRVMQLKPPRETFAKALLAALNVRLIRVLCDECKVGYPPAPELLKKLSIPSGKVEQLYRTPTAEEASKPCPKCAGSGYFGRTGLFELLVADDQVRETLIKQPKLDAVRKACRYAGMRTMQEEGVLLVAKGATSLQELQRVLKQ